MSFSAFLRGLLLANFILVSLVLGACQGQEMSDPLMAGLMANAEGRLVPANHAVDWIRRHGTVVHAQGNECTSCHMEEDCMGCHVEQIAISYSVHPPNFVTIHASDARANLSGCTDCYKVDVFCATCHIQARVSPL